MRFSLWKSSMHFLSLSLLELRKARQMPWRVNFQLRSVETAFSKSEK